MSHQPQQPIVAHPAQTNATAATEAVYELPPFADVFAAVTKFQRKQNIQDMLEALANDGYYVVRRRNK